jgi:Flp pilus assembly protein CpaB
VTVGHVAPFALAALAFVLVLAVQRGKSQTVQVPVAASAINAGDPVTTANVRMVTMHAQDSAARSGLVAPADLAASQNWVAAVLIRAGDPITHSEIAKASGPTGLGSMSLQVPIEHADGGALTAGDRVDVIGQINGASVYEARGLQVLSVASTAKAGGLGGTSGNYYVVVAVDTDTALRLAQAVATKGSGGVIDIVRTTGVAGDQLGTVTPSTGGATGVSPASGHSTTTQVGR